MNVNGNPINMLPVGRQACVQTPATCANLGPGFDTLGLALDWADTSHAEVTKQGITFDLTGPNTDSLPRTENHLVVKTLLDTLDHFKMGVPGLHFKSNVTIPFASGLGSSSAAIVSGILLAWALAKPGEPLDREWVFNRACGIEGHGDNVGPATMGGFTVNWFVKQKNSVEPVSKIQRCHVRDDVRALTVIPQLELHTENARAVLPKKVPMGDAISNMSRCALLVYALAHQPSLLFDATADCLHQVYRASLLPQSHKLLMFLREQGHAAVISGAGPTVTVLHSASDTQNLLNEIGNMSSTRNTTVKVLRVGRGAQILS